jgi:hypothetical protein
LVTKGQELMFVATVDLPVVGKGEVVDEDEGLVSAGEPVPVVVALVELPPTPVGAGVAVESPT